MLARESLCVCVCWVSFISFQINHSETCQPSKIHSKLSLSLCTHPPPPRNLTLNPPPHGCCHGNRPPLSGGSMFNAPLRSDLLWHRLAESLSHVIPEQPVRMQDLNQPPWTPTSPPHKVSSPLRRPLTSFGEGDGSWCLDYHTITMSRVLHKKAVVTFICWMKGFSVLTLKII